MSQPTVRVLLTEDVASDAELEVRELRRAGLRLTHRVVTSEGSFTQALREFSPDVILSDFSMPGFDGMAALSIARELAPEVDPMRLSVPHLLRFLAQRDPAPAATSVAAAAGPGGG